MTEAQLVTARPVVRAVAARYRNAGDVEDLAQEALLRLWEHREDFTGVDVSHFAARVTRRVCIDLARSRTRERDALDRIEGAGGYYPRGVATPEETLIVSETARIFVAETKRRALWASRRAALSKARLATAALAA